MNREDSELASVLTLRQVTDLLSDMLGIPELRPIENQPARFF